MITRPQNSKFPHSVIQYSMYWTQRKTTLVLGGSLLILILSGGLFFLASASSSVLTNNTTNQSELEVARSGLQTIKRMVSDQTAWSTSIQEEYNKLFVAQLSTPQPTNSMHRNSYIGPDNSSHQVVAK